MYFRRKKISKMLSQREQNIIIEAMKPFKSTKIAFSDLDSNENKLELLYHFDNSPGYIGFMGLVRNLEAQLNRKIDLTSFDFIDSFVKEDVLREAKIFFDGEKEKLRFSEIVGH